MKKENLNIERYTYNLKDKKYLIYVFSEENNITEFYIQRENYGIISSTVGFNFDELEEKITIENYINENIADWIEICETDILRLEREN